MTLKKKQDRILDLETMAYKIEEKIILQKERFCGLEQGPKSPENFLHIVDLVYVFPHEKKIVK